MSLKNPIAECIYCHKIKKLKYKNKCWACIIRNKPKEFCKICKKIKKLRYKKSCITCLNKLKYGARYERNKRLQRKYGISIEFYEELYEKQNKKCDICQKIQKKLVVDHNHKTKKVRGLLCELCNLGLGGFRDKEKNLLNAIKYLKK